MTAPVWALTAGLLAVAGIVWIAVFYPHRRQGGNLPAGGEGMKPQLKEAIACLEPEEACQLLMQVFPGLSPADREELGEELVSAGLVGRFAKVLSEGTGGQRVIAAEILGYTGTVLALEPLMEALADRVDAVSLAAARALSRLDSPAKVPVLVAALAEPNKWLPARVGQVLLSMGEAAVMPLLEALAAGAPGTRCLAADLLGELGDARAVDGLVAALESEDAKVRAHAAEALGCLGVSGAIPALMAAMADPSWEVRSRAAKSLGHLRAQEAVPLLETAAKDPQWWVRASAEAALAEVAASSEAGSQTPTLPGRHHQSMKNSSRGAGGGSGFPGGAIGGESSRTAGG